MFHFVLNTPSQLEERSWWCASHWEGLWGVSCASVKYENSDGRGLPTTCCDLFQCRFKYSLLPERLNYILLSERSVPFQVQPFCQNVQWRFKYSLLSERLNYILLSESSVTFQVQPFCQNVQCRFKCSLLSERSVPFQVQPFCQNVHCRFKYSLLSERSVTFKVHLFFLFSFFVRTCCAVSSTSVFQNVSVPFKLHPFVKTFNAESNVDFCGCFLM